MGFARLVLALSGLIFTAYGLYCVVDPYFAAGQIGYAVANSSAIIEVIAMYGGLQLALGLVLLYCAAVVHWTMPGLTLLVICSICLASTRTFGISLYGADTYNLGALGYETSTAILAIIAWQLQRYKSGG